MKFSKVNAVRIPKGSAKRIRHNGNVLWAPVAARYVSFGDSIAVGHRINDNWEKDYGWNAQYGVDGRTETVIVPGCYTDLIHRDLIVRMGGKVNTTSFARSGDKVSDLIDKLSHSAVRTALSKADYVTVCIGANDVLHYALVGLPEYINTGDLSTIDAQVDASLAVLNDDNASTSYLALFNKLMSVNAKAKYVFTTVYNPYKYLWIDGDKNGFFKPMLDTIPQMTILGFEVDELIKDGLLSTPAISNFVTRINGICDKAEDYVTRLNTILRTKLTAFQASNQNLFLADAKAVFDPVPDRPITAPKHYNDLVNVEFTRGYTTADIRWYPLWVDKYGEDYQQFWWDLASKHVSLEKGFDIMGFARELVPMIVEKMIEPNVDPHPEEYGHYALSCSFSETFGWSSMPRRTIEYNANGGKGKMASQTLVALDGNTAYVNLSQLGFSPGADGYGFVGWNTKADGSGASYSNGQLVGLTGDLTLYAQWGLNKRTLTVIQANKTTMVSGSLTSADYHNRKLYIGGSQQKLNDDKSSWSNVVGQVDTTEFVVEYGTAIKLSVQGRVENLMGSGPNPDCRIYQYNGSDYAQKVVGKVANAEFTMPDRDITIEFWFDASANIQYSHYYWNGYIGDKDLNVTYS